MRVGCSVSRWNRQAGNGRLCGRIRVSSDLVCKRRRWQEERCHFRVAGGRSRNGIEVLSIVFTRRTGNQVVVEVWQCWQQPE